MRISPENMQKNLHKLFVTYGFTHDKAKLLATIFTESTLDGVSSHGINRVPRFIEHITKGVIQTNAEAEKINSFGSIERWDGNFGPGPVNASICADRAIVLAKQHGIGMVALRNTNHWMRGGTYAKQAAESGCISILFTNTQANMPPWGGKEARIGNNPFVVAIPRKKGNVILDMAISQFSFGKINDYKLKGKQLPFHGGWDDKHQLSKDPEKILKKERGLPIGYWKGSALSMILDMLATILSAGNSTCSISKKEIETGISQVYICIYPNVFSDNGLQETLLQEIIDFTKNVESINPEGCIFYPGEQSSQKRLKNLKEGIYVNDNVWEQVIALSGK